MSVTFRLNGGSQTLAIDPTTPLLYVLRGTVGLNAAKFGCGT
jgi:aerobic-type carbon monoxide dehydrogenase small subunit (CoxS/CutS family)